jgi:hypothetical protein
MNPTDTGHIKSLSFGGPRLETGHGGTKLKRNLGIKTLSMETHIVKDINIWKLNLKPKRGHTEVKTLTTPGLSLNLEDEILVRGVECNIPEILMIYHV